MQIIPVKFRGVWILHSEILEFEFYPLKFGDVWILHLDVSKVEFYALNFRGVWILYPKVSEFEGVKSKYFQTLGGKIQILKLQSIKFKHPKL